MVVSPSIGQEQNTAALAGDRFSIDGQEFHLANIIAPSEYALGARSAPYFEGAKQRLAQLLAGAALEIVDVAAKTRWGGRVVIARRVDDKQSLQHLLISAGAARVAPQTDDHTTIDELLALENEARRSRRGLWSRQFYKIHNAQSAETAIGAYNLIEGTVLRAVRARGRFYLNFGDDYKTDFTASAPSRAYQRWKKNDFDIALFEGATLRIRGFVNRINGPSIDLKHRKQIELI